MSLRPLATLLDALPVAFVAHDADHNVVLWNPAAEKLLGWSRNEVLGRPSPIPSAILDTVIRTDAAQVPRVWLMDRQGHEREVAAAMMPIPGHPAMALVLWSVETAPEVPAAPSELLYARLFQSAGEAMVICDARNNILAVNESFSRITGYTAAEVIGKNPSILSSGRHDAVFYARLWSALSGTGTWRGELWNRRKSGEVYCEWATLSAIRDSQGRVTNYVAVFADITAVKETERQVTYLAQRDHLTGLPNRTLLKDRLDQALGAAARSEQQVALMIVDLDGFKSINSSLGPTEGDLLIKEVASRLEGSVRVGDTVARMGGDEFAIVVTALDSSTESLTVESRVRAVIGAPLHLAGQDLRLTASIGIALYPQDGEDSDHLLSRADAAMYAAKDAGRNTSRFFTAAMNASALERMSLTHGLGRALEQRELCLHFQPQRPIGTERLIGVEALLRWQHPELGMVPPDRFISLAEETGLIRPIGVWVLKESALQAKAWGIPVSVNLSVMQLQDPEFYLQVEAVLAETGVAPGLIELEVTESVVMKDPDASIAMLSRLKALGLGLSMDDFGTGYSSLTQLKRLPLDRLKIDRAFVREVLTDPADQAVVQAVIAMGHALGLRIIAEGVETAEQRVLLAGYGCDEVQGYLCGRPMPPDRIDAEIQGVPA
ncbi:MAG: EAL domain-containing protein [Myxococcota bacterium]